MDDLAQLGVGRSDAAAADHEDDLHIVGEQALAQHALTDHAGRAEQDDFHARQSMRDPHVV